MLYARMAVQPARWQGGVEADEARLRALTDFTRFTGLHRGAEALVVAMPAAGWAERGRSAAEVAYAEQLSRSRVKVGSLQQQQSEQRITGDNARGGVGGPGVMERGAGGAAKQTTATGRAAAAASGLMLRHVVSAQDVIAQT